jgi:hypothetical protein
LSNILKGNSSLIVGLTMAEKVKRERIGKRYKRKENRFGRREIDE